MSQGFVGSFRPAAIARDTFGASPGCFETNLTATSRVGTSLTAHATPHTKATTYTDLIASTAQQAFGIWVAGFDAGASNADTGQLLDIATGAASSEVDLIQNIDMGEAPLSLTGHSGKIIYFPGLNIPASTRISARIQATITVDTINVAIWMDYRMQWHVANSSWVTYGADTANSRGTSVPGAVDAFGAWTAIGSVTSRNHNLFTIGTDSLGDTTLSGTGMAGLLEIGYGPDAGSVTSIGVCQIMHAANELVSGIFPPILAFSVASGSQLWARLAANGTETRGVIIYGN